MIAVSRTITRSQITRFSSADPRRQQVVHVQGAGEPAVFVQDEERGDLPFFHAGEGSRSELVGADRAGVGVKAVSGRAGEELRIFFDKTAQVSVGDDANQAPRAVDDGREAHHLARHLVNRLGHRRLGRDTRDALACSHQVLDLQKSLSEIAIASASPTARRAVVEAVGARFKGQASREIETESVRSAARAMDESGAPVMAIVRSDRARAKSSSRTISGDSPEAERANTMSPATSIPRSPWEASAAWRK